MITGSCVRQRWEDLWRTRPETPTVRLRDKPVLVDTNVILEAHLTGCWDALAGGYNLETVEKCIEETQTGNQLRERKVEIDERALRASLTVNEVDEDEVLVLRLYGGSSVHDGELHLWTHALAREDAWIFCGPDGGSMRLGHRQGHGARIVHLEGLLHEIGLKLPRSAGQHFGRRWHEKFMTDLALGLI